jgi:VanZ family protein
MNPILFRRLLFWAAMIFAFVMAIVPQPPDLPGEPGDKIQHVIAFATLAALGSWAYVSASAGKLLAGLSLFGALIEFVQAIPAVHRDSDVKDWIADTIAAAVVIAIITIWRARRRRDGQSAP